MLILLLILPTTTCTKRNLKCVTGHRIDSHTLSDLTIAWCSSSRHTTCYTQRTRLSGEDKTKTSFVYGCGHCLYNDTDKECRECSEDVCNTPHTYWNMTFIELPTKPAKPVKVFVPFKERANFPQYEAIAEPFIWAFPVAVLALFVSGAVFIAVRAHVEDWHYWCVRYWE